MENDYLWLGGRWFGGQKAVEEPAIQAMKLKASGPFFREKIKIIFAKLPGYIKLLCTIIFKDLSLVIPVFFEKVAVLSRFETEGRGLANKPSGLWPVLNYR